MQRQDNAPDEPSQLLECSKGGRLGVVHEYAEVFAQGKLDEAQRDGVRCHKVTDVEDAGCPAELLAHQALNPPSVSGWLSADPEG
jgi:hypothetical protein